MLTDFLFCFAE